MYINHVAGITWLRGTSDMHRNLRFDSCRRADSACFATAFANVNFFQCHVFAMKSVQNLKSFWRSSQNYFVLALFSSL